uniref:Fibronectin type-III domain-containing protein n=1 Tax=Periophthalmus magnuspinnatus TaxID=409849 RepID=A0A3B4APV4_9GOBI
GLSPAFGSTSSSFVVSWVPPQAEIDGYILTYSSSEGTSEEIPLKADQSSHKLSALRPGVLYTVHVWAVRGSKASYRGGCNSWRGKNSRAEHGA